jgi:hypothetical protein
MSLTIINESITDIRKEDNYINATKLCKSAGKSWSNYFQLKTTNEFIDELSRSLELNKDILVQTTITGPNDLRGTWIHPLMKNHLLHWINQSLSDKKHHYIYLITSSYITFIKIGYWRGLLKNLYNRYSTMYGKLYQFIIFQFQIVKKLNMTYLNILVVIDYVTMNFLTKHILMNMYHI